MNWQIQKNNLQDRKGLEGALDQFFVRETSPFTLACIMGEEVLIMRGVYIVILKLLWGLQT